MNNLKQYIKEFDFERPRFEGLPDNFPKVSKKGLTEEERHLLDAIIVAWIVNKSSAFGSVGAYVQTNDFLNSTISFNLKLAKAVFAFFLIAAFSISFISVTYYLNIEFDLGLTFLTEMFV